MDSESLYYSLEFVSGSGHTLNLEQRAALRTSLLIMKKNYNFQRVLLWGKILGIKQDYFIAQGRGEDELQDRKSLYSFDCMNWFLLPPVTDCMIEEAQAAKGRFMGDPSHVYKLLQGDGEAVAKVKEETRLIVTIHQIDEDVSVVPRGAFIKNPQGLVQINRSFGGLSHSESGRLDNFFHFSKPKNLKKKSILEKADLNPAIDFLDMLSDDVPKASWSLQYQSAGQARVLRSLLWLGLTFYHVPMTPQHGYLYFGDGLKNTYLPFML